MSAAAAAPAAACAAPAVIVVGSGAAGMACALALAPHPVVLVTKTAGLPGGSSLWAQGGIACALGEADSAEAHAADTVTAGAGTVDAAAAALLAEAGIGETRRLIAAGLPADRTPGGAVVLGLVAAHSADRIVHAGGDATGARLVETLAALVAAAPHIRLQTDTTALRLLRQGSRVVGLAGHHAGSGTVVLSGPVVLATGGIGGLFAATYNPAEATADGLALAARAGAELADLEMVQFHPTALAVPGAEGRLPLLTEALRGAGAVLCDAAGRPFMAAEHPLADLAPRDVVARAIGRRVAAGEAVFLDLRPALAARGAAAFPQVMALLAEHGFDPLAAPVPVTPAAHYHMGGVLTDLDGRTSLPGLWACGEVACTGVHGANRLASNSLLEALVFARRVAASVLAAPSQPVPTGAEAPPRAADPADSAAAAATVRRLMSAHLGLVRSAAGLGEALAGLAAAADRFAAVPRRHADAAAIRAEAEAANLLLVARLLAAAALRRGESRGAHCRTDAPATGDGWGRRHVVTLSALLSPAAAEAAA
ncbi:L-aspartate oxidase [Caenispirillum bisanense]|uniref:L-aspartate oxidase n=1 Tax=Caenispirillum bisanense TaxID=414052 RepID=UPI0031DBF6EE